MRVELLLELSGISRQEALLVKACTSDSRESVCATFVEHYSGARGAWTYRRQHRARSRRERKDRGYEALYPLYERKLGGLLDEKKEGGQMPALGGYGVLAWARELSC